MLANSNSYFLKNITETKQLFCFIEKFLINKNNYDLEISFTEYEKEICILEITNSKKFLSFCLNQENYIKVSYTGEDIKPLFIKNKTNNQDYLLDKLYLHNNQWFYTEQIQENSCVNPEFLINYLFKALFEK